MAITAAEATAFTSLFAKYRNIADLRDRLNFACRNPILLSGEIVGTFAQQFDSDPDAKPDGRLERVIELGTFGKTIADNVSRYPAGEGPIEDQGARVMTGATSLKAAIARVRRRDFHVHLSPLYVHALTWHAQQLVTRNEAATAMLWGRLLAEACEAACPGKSINKNLEIAAAGFIGIVGVALALIPDGEMLQAADVLGKNLLDRLTSPEADPRRGAVLHALGVLYSDPVTGTSGWGLEEVHRLQQLRRLEALKGPAAAREHHEKYPIPNARDALRTALSYYERALADRRGHARGITLKATVQTMDSLARAKGEALDRERARQLCAEALPLLAPGEYQYRALVALMDRLGLEGAPAPADDLAADSPETVLQLMAMHRPTDPARALNILVDAADLFRESGTERLRQKRLVAMVSLIRRVHGGEFDVPVDGPLQQTVERIANTARDEQWPADRLFATMFSLATDSDRSNDEAVGLRLLTVVNEKSPRIAAYQEAVAYVYATLSIGEAVNRLDAGDARAAVENYGRALAPMFRLGMPSTALDVLARMADAALRPAGGMLLAVVVGTAPVAYEIDRQLGTAGAEAFQAVYRNAFANLDNVNSAEIGMLLQLAKGARFSATLRQAPTFDWRSDPTAVNLSEQIARLQHEIGWIDEFSPMNEVLLVSASGSAEARSGDTETERLLNLQRAMDRHVNGLLIEGVRSSAILKPKVIGQLLGPDTVLLDYYFAPCGDKQQAVYIVVYTREEIVFFANLAGERQEYSAAADGIEATLDTLGARTFRIRQWLQLDPADPETAHLHPDAKQALVEDFEVLLGMPTWEYLERLRESGKTHLCIRPYGALRYYPLHLLGPNDQDLAERWTVTSIPSLECLLQPTPPRRANPAQALGLSYKNGQPFPLAELGGAHREVKAIAAATRTNPQLDEAVTEAKVFAALRANRWLHLCAHGANNAVSPLFQHLFVTPDEKSDGRINAYEIYGNDLRGLELLSLASCDSALGRFDAGDNLNGLPAALLAAGVSTIVASLWELSDDAAAAFFPRLYSELARGVPRREAFRQAQLAVRAAFPQPRDWAAFTYLGAWSDVDPAILADKGAYIKLEK